MSQPALQPTEVEQQILKENQHVNTEKSLQRERIGRIHHKEITTQNNITNTSERRERDRSQRTDQRKRTGHENDIQNPSKIK
jgi:hypothetical protein